MMTVEEKKRQKIEVNNRMVGKTVEVINKEMNYLVEVIKVVDEDTFLVRYGDREFPVDIFDIRAV